MVSGSFGTNGDVGFVNSPSNLAISFGSQGSIYQLDGFLNVAGQNLTNDGSGIGTSADLSYGTPAGISYAFSAAQPTADQLLLKYAFTNTTAAKISSVQFLSFVDGDIGPNFADESAVVTDLLGSGASSYEVGDPSTSTLFTDLKDGTLSDTNAFPPGTAGDVATGEGYTFDLPAGQTVDVNVLLSDNATTLGSLAITQTDAAFPADTLTASGIITAVPEASTAGLLAVGCLAPLLLRRRHSGSPEIA